MILNIDGDLIAYRCSASVGDLGSEEIAILRTDKLMRDLIYFTESEAFRCFISGRNNFRKKVNPLYKANRTQPPPKWLQACREYLSKEWGAIEAHGKEADDLLGISQDENTICASLDKDLQMIPGWHYNWLASEKTYVVPLDGLRTFYKQMLIGDRSDNIFGVDGIGKVKAARLIDPMETEQEMIESVFNLYNEDAARFWMNAQCLWIMQKENETWQDRIDVSILPDQLKQELVTRSDFMKSLMGNISTEPTMMPKMTSGIPSNGDLMVEDIQTIETIMI